MPEYKLFYFPGRELGEVSRQLFYLSGTKFEDHRISMEDWPAFKHKTPFGQMPMLLVDDKPIPQSFAIARFLAKEFGFAGKTNFEAAWIDALGDQFKDYMMKIHALLAVIYGFSSGDKEALMRSIGAPARDKFFGLIERRLADNAPSSGYLVGDSLSWIDLQLADHAGTMAALLPGYLDDFPRTREHRRLITSDARLRGWLESRPVTPF